ncbi:HpcH/HpaI aldolase/citrate lyase family protein [Sphingomonas xanthus]|uniref:HpcH/HpaI aldolase/citrate lyase family protein n=1 Tax=Sphingomonas xanthus TaxID=2594473 RepID=UPI003CCC5908
MNLFDKRAVLFLPANNPRAIAKARASDADLVILDLEDAVGPEQKEEARAAAVEAVDEAWPMPVAIRINAVRTQWHGLDVLAAAHSEADLVIVPRAESQQDLHYLRSHTGKPVAAMIETAKGVLASRAIAEETVALIAGTNDLAADLRLPRGAGKAPMQTALQMIVLSARAAGIAAFDGVFNALDDLEGFAAEAAEARMMGFDGKTLIHPNQIAPCHAAFSPSDEEVARAMRLVDAATGGAERFEGEMIERMHVEAARRLLARSPRS